MFNNINWQDLSKAFLYDAERPLIFTNGLFLLLIGLFMMGYGAFFKKDIVRNILLTLFGFYFYYLASGPFLLLLLITITLDYLFSSIIESSENKTIRKIGVSLGVGFSLAFLMWFKYRLFFQQTTGVIYGDPLSPSDIILPIGISFYTFQSISYLVDVYKRKVVVPEFQDYLLYMTFFPHLVAGPIVRARDFLPQLNDRPAVNKDHFNEGFYLITKGFIKKALIADFVCRYSDAVFSAPASFSGFEHIISTLCYTLQIYCDFSGYTDMAIGIALLLGYRLCLNFDSPYTAVNITDFWRRWHISLSSWLRDYIYIPMGGNKRGYLPQLLFLLLTMLIGGFWHGADWKFIFWGGAHGMMLILHKLYMRFVPKGKSYSVFSFISWMITFICVALLWVPFRANSLSDALMVYNNILYKSNIYALEQIYNFNPLLIWFLFGGFAIILIPRVMKNRLQTLYMKMPGILKFLLLAIVIQLVIQVADADVQPFIYFQF